MLGTVVKNAPLWMPPTRTYDDIIAVMGDSLWIQPQTSHRHPLETGDRREDRLCFTKLVHVLRILWQCIVSTPARWTVLTKASKSVHDHEFTRRGHGGMWDAYHQRNYLIPAASLLRLMNHCRVESEPTATYILMGD
jgi:hypothetical protein